MQRRIGSKQAISNEVQHSCAVKRSLHFKLKSKTASKIVTQRSTILIFPPPSWVPLVVVSLGNCPVSRKSQNTTNLFLRRIFRRSTNSYTLHYSKTKILFKDIEVSYSTSFTATGISMLQMYSQTAVGLRPARSLRCCCSKP